MKQDKFTVCRANYKPEVPQTKKKNRKKEKVTKNTNKNYNTTNI